MGTTRTKHLGVTGILLPGHPGINPTPRIKQSLLRYSIMLHTNTTDKVHTSDLVCYESSKTGNKKLHNNAFILQQLLYTPVLQRDVL